MSSMRKINQLLADIKSNEIGSLGEKLRATALIAGFTACFTGIGIAVYASEKKDDRAKAAAFREATTPEALGAAVNHCRAFVTRDGGTGQVKVDLHSYYRISNDSNRLNADYDSLFTDRDVSVNLGQPTEMTVVDAAGQRQTYPIPENTTKLGSGENYEGEKRYWYDTTVEIGQSEPPASISIITAPLNVYPQGNDGPPQPVAPIVNCELN